MIEIWTQNLNKRKKIYPNDLKLHFWPYGTTNSLDILAKIEVFGKKYANFDQILQLKLYSHKK